VRAWAFLDPELVLAQARALDAAPERGPLQGVPLGVKDVIDTFDMPTQMGSPIYAGYRPVADAACVALARSAGALIVGKTVTAEFAGIGPGPTTNPLDPARTPGGSSSGSAAAVAGGMIPVALGTQTGGSVHRPASYCGIIGFKPTQCTINRAGVKPAAERFDTIGILARDLDDVSLLFAVLTNGAAPVGATARKPERIGLCRTPLWSRAQPETVAAVEESAGCLRRAGITVAEVTLPPIFDALNGARSTINDYQRAQALRHEWQTQPDAFSAQMARVVRHGLTVSLDELNAAIRVAEQCRTALDGAFGDMDLLLAPCVDGEAPCGLESTGEHHFQSLWTTVDVPTSSLPAHRGPNGLPVSIQLVARPLHDIDLLGFTRWIAHALASN
jgi:Asp-tRNA(Asn)/Glu-tRNA(Gln) amidotransferase A subunit family amidase